ncbi:putative tubulin polyglutamylase [Tribonema minus]|uniref:Tubulin--tyrosine ligase-like protein 9 n=1 Tax=Tribonema minus TaxID=303371 RepID=A0A836C6U9_9STRA|nr:putative tubulin polyglutamylase [Tribonema minus]
MEQEGPHRKTDAKSQSGGILRTVKFHTSFVPGSLVHRALSQREGWMETEDASEAELLWVERDAANEVLDATQQFCSKQRINHFRNDRELCRKDLLVKNLKRRKRQLERESSQAPESDTADCYDFWPETYVLPSDYDLFVQAYKTAPDSVWVAKPINGSQGRGIFLFSKLSQISRWRNDGIKREDGPETYVVQHYINKPYLIAGRKFDIRLYALATSFQPLTAYIHRGGFCRFSAVRYQQATAATPDAAMERHLTNVAIQRRGEGYDRTFSGKWDVRSLKLHLVTALGAAAAEALFQRVERLVASSLRAVRDVMITDRRCFELYGYDVLIDADLKPWLLEVNASPALSATTRADHVFKTKLLSDALDVVDVEGRRGGVAPVARMGGFELMCLGGEVAQPKDGSAYRSIVGTDMEYAASERYEASHVIGSRAE